MGVSKVFLRNFAPTRYGDQTLGLSGWRALSSRVLTVAPCTCCVNLYVCMYKVSILAVFQYFLSLYHSVSIFLPVSFPFLISNKSCSNDPRMLMILNYDAVSVRSIQISLFSVVWRARSSVMCSLIVGNARLFQVRSAVNQTKYYSRGQATGAELKIICVPKSLYLAAHFWYFAWI